MPRRPITGTKQRPPDGTLELRFGGTLGPASWEVVHFFLTDALTETPPRDLDSMVDQISAYFASDLVHPFCSPGTKYVTTHGVLVKSDGERWKTRRVYDVSGEAAGPPAPVQVSYLIGWEPINLFGRAQPRSYLPGVPILHINDGAHLEASVIPGLQDHANDYIAHVNSVTSGPIAAVIFVAISFVHNHAYRAFPVPFPILQARLNPVLATQRRRLERVTP